METLYTNKITIYFSHWFFREIVKFSIKQYTNITEQLLFRFRSRNGLFKNRKKYNIVLCDISAPIRCEEKI